MTTPLFSIVGLTTFLALVAPGANAAAPPFSATRTDAQDLEMIILNESGSVTRFYKYDDLIKLPLVKVHTEKDPNTLKPAEYTGVYLADLAADLDLPEKDPVIAANCYDRYKQYFDQTYLQTHRPILLLAYDGLPPAQWPPAERNQAMGPYCVVHENFQPAEHIYGYVEEPRIPFGVVSLELSANADFRNAFAPKRMKDDPEVQKGYHIVLGACINCHNQGTIGGQLAQRPWLILAANAASNEDYFRKVVVNPQQFDPKTSMPARPNFDQRTLDALVRYFKTML